MSLSGLQRVNISTRYPTEPVGMTPQLVSMMRDGRGHGTKKTTTTTLDRDWVCARAPVASLLSGTLLDSYVMGIVVVGLGGGPR